MKKTQKSAFLLVLFIFSGLLYAEDCASGVSGECKVNDPLPPAACCLPGLVCSDLSACLIPSGSTQYACVENKECLSGICNSGTCVSFQACDGECALSSECGSECPLCVDDGGTGYCRACVPTDSPCSSSNSCCPGDICSPSKNTCVSCLSQDEECASSPQCCSGRCMETDEPGLKKCAPEFSCGMPFGPCTSSEFECCSSPPSISSAVCDIYNPLPSSGFSGSCVAGCVPSGLNCMGGGVLPCCGASLGYECLETKSSYGYKFCVAHPESGEHYLFPGWVSNGEDPQFIPDSGSPHSGSYAIKVSSGDPLNQIYIYNPGVILKENSKYALEFWASQKIYLAIYDPNNDAYYNLSSKAWSFSPRDVDGKEAPVINTLPNGGGYEHYLERFSTLPSNVSQIQVRFYLGDNEYFVDDLTITELNDFSMFAWIKLDKEAVGYIFRQIDEKEGQPQGFSWSQQGLDISMEYFSAYGVEGTNTLTTLISLKDFKWHHVGFVANRLGSYETYLDGVQVATSAFQLGRINSTANFTIGVEGGNPFSGTIDEIRFYERALSQGEVAGIYGGKYQDKCTVQTTVSYGDVPLAQRYSHYNANLKIRSLSGAIMSFPFDVNISALNTRAIRDYSPSQRLASNTGAIWHSDGAMGGAYLFNGESDYINVTTGTLGDLAFHTITAWVNLDYGGHSSDYAIFAAQDIESTYSGISLYVNPADGQLGGYLKDAFQYSKNSAVPENEWAFVAIRGFRDASSGYVEVSVNASPWEKIYSGDTSGLELSTDNPVTIGAWAGGNYFAKGYIDEVRAYDRLLSESEISSLYKDAGLLLNSTVRSPTVSIPS